MSQINTTINKKKLNLTPAWLTDRVQDILININCSIWLASCLAAIGMLIVGIVQKTQFPPMQKDFYMQFEPFTQGWEYPVIFTILIVFFISTSLLPEFGFVSVAVAGMGTFFLFAFMSLSSFPSALAAYEEPQAWLQEYHDLTALNSGNRIDFSEPLLVQGEDKKIYEITFKDNNGKFSIASKTQQ